MAHHVLIFGGTGLLGEHITNAIVHSADKLGQISLFTSENTIWTKSEYINLLKQRGVTILSGNISSKHDVTEAFTGVDIVVSCVGRQAISKQIDLIQWADEHPDVKHFFPSEFGTDIEYGPASAHEPPHQQKLKVRAALKQVKNLDYTYVVTGPYGDGNSGCYLSAMKPEAEVIGTFNVAEKRAILLGDGHGKISLTTMRDVGKFVVASILHLSHVKNKALKVNSFTSTPASILKEFERQTGSTWEHSTTSLEDLKSTETKAWASESPTATMTTLRRIWTEGGTLYSKRDNDLIGMEMGTDSLESAVAQAIEIQKA
ncbi:hypothetical protein AMS68_007004 [Peltaster fructicola]|uniref:NmrA-like domain-containing protein n=1 Tax=Peltaster fructicola TaxID=286661 RepID=A0A6H0Y3A4_9PEZI|nr:hypothetical protein AMS68_007004 [Peltaster fructicola]